MAWYFPCHRGLVAVDITTPTLAVLAFGALFWFLFQQRYLFVVRIRHGVPRLAKGKVTAAFLQELQSLCAESHVTHGWVGGVRHGKQVRLTFSRDIPGQCQQRLRNLWQLVS